MLASETHRGLFIGRVVQFDVEVPDFGQRCQCLCGREPTSAFRHNKGVSQFSPEQAGRRCTVGPGLPEDPVGAGHALVLAW